MTKLIPPFILLFSCIINVAAFADHPKPEDKPGYDNAKDVGAAAPAGADVPFSGKDASMEAVKEVWEMWPKPDMEITWKLMPDPAGGEGMTLMADGGKRWGTHDLVTKKTYTDFEAHVEFVMMGKRGDDSAEGYSNSGVYLQNRYEIQIESPKGKNTADPYAWKIGPHGIGAFCMERVPDTNAWRPNGQWHAFHIEFKAATWDGKKPVEPARATVWWNGVKVHDNVAIKKANGGIPVGPAPGGLKLQEHGQDVRYRNVWIVDRSADAGKKTSQNNAILRGHLKHSEAAMKSGKATVAFMGGSITEMDGYRPMVMKELARRYPDTDFTFINAGISSTCSTSGAFRFQEHVLDHGTPDLFFLEFAVNDDQDAGHSRENCIRGMEGIIRQARAANPNMDIIVTTFVNEPMIKAYQAGRVPLSVAAHEEVLEHYGISASMLARQVSADLAEEKYTWKTFGGVHPKPFGNQINADAIANILDQALKVEGEATPLPTPAMMDEASYVNVKWLKPSAATGTGEVKIPEWKALKGGKRGRYKEIDLYCLETAGESCELVFEGIHVGAFVIAGPDAGVVEVEIDGEAKGEVDLFHHYSKGLHYPRTVMFATDLEPGKHRIKLTMTDQGKGQAFRAWRWAVR